MNAPVRHRVNIPALVARWAAVECYKETCR